MKILALDTSTLVASVALLDGQRVIYEATMENGNTHSQSLLPMMDAAVAAVGWKRSDIGAVAVSQGPGSFTGLRIAMATAKGLACALGIPVAPVGTLPALAMGVIPFDGLIVPMVDARRGLVYAASYRREGGLPSEVMAPRAIMTEDLAETLRTCESPILFTGDGVRAYGEALAAALGEKAQLAPSHLMMQRASAVGLLGAALLAAGPVPDPRTLTPFYLRQTQAKLLSEQKKARSE